MNIVNGLMAIPNLIALLGLTGVIVAEQTLYRTFGEAKEKADISEEVAEEA